MNDVPDDQGDTGLGETMKMTPPQRDAQEDQRPHWNSMACQWQHVGPPLRPCGADIDVIQSSIAERRSGALRVLLLGVTPEIVLLAWPPGTRLDAVERSPGMIDQVWPGDIRGVRRAHQGEWVDLPFPSDSFDVVIGDGCYSCMKFADGYRQLSRSIDRVLKRDGMAIMRLFVAPARKEQPDDVVTDLMAGRIGSFHAFKWRLAMATQVDPEPDVCLHDVWRTWARYEIETAKLAERTGWTAESIRTIDLYRNKETRLSFPRREQAVSEIETIFDVRRMHTSTYELGERCPMLFLQPRT